MNVNGRLGADAIQRMQQAQQTNAPQVESQNEETSQTVRKPLSKSEVAAMMKGNVGEPTSNVNTDIVTTQEAQAADHDNNEAPMLYTQWKDYGSLRRNGKKGDFCLGVNTIAGKMVYSLYFKNDQGHIERRELSADDFTALSGYNGTIGQ